MPGLGQAGGESTTRESVCCVATLSQLPIFCFAIWVLFYSVHRSCKALKTLNTPVRRFSHTKECSNSFLGKQATFGQVSLSYYHSLHPMPPNAMCLSFVGNHIICTIKNLFSLYGTIYKKSVFTDRKMVVYSSTLHHGSPAYGRPCHLNRRIAVNVGRNLHMCSWKERIFTFYS